jgi:hypothetical protein
MKKFINLKILFLLAVICSSSPEFDVISGKISNKKYLLDPPRITWLNPSQQYTILKSTKVNIKATIISTIGIKSVFVYLNDVLYGEAEMTPSSTEIGNYLISKSVSLVSGENCIYLVATNGEGSTTSEKRYFTFPHPDKKNDSTAISLTGAPIVIWTNPSGANSTLKSTKANIKATVRSTIGIKSVLIYLNNVLYGEPEMNPSLTEMGSYVISKSINFEPGENSIYLVANNGEGSTTSEKRYFTIPVPDKRNDSIAISLPAVPIITWTNPSGTNSILKSLKANVKATVRSAGGLKSVLVYLNDVVYGEPEMIPSLTEIGSYNISKSINFEPGDNSIYIVATNSIGTTTSEKRYFTFPVVVKTIDLVAMPLPIPPSITWTIPTGKNTTLKSSSTNIKVTIRSASELKSVVLYLNNASQGEAEIKPVQNEKDSYLIDKTLNFRQVENNIYIVAGNSAGDTRSEPRSFICPLSSLLANQSPNKVVPVTNNSSSATSPAAPVAIAPETASPKPTAPSINWISPSGSQTTLEFFNATVKANIKSYYGLKSVLLYLNGISKGEIEIKPLREETGSYLIEKNINFGPGENNIYLVATNSEGSTKSEVRYFSNPSAVAPVIKWSTPESPNSLVSTESFTIGACIKSSSELRSVKLLVNGNIQVEDNLFQASTSDDCNYNWQSSIVLREGDNSIFIIAANAAGSSTSEKRVIKLTTGLTEKRLALVLGNSQYKNSAPLKNPVNDANLMEATLKDLGFRVIKRLDAGRNEMLSAIREFEDKLPDFNVALFYYAGHGNQVDGKNYLIPTDAKLEKPSDCKFEAIEVNLIVDEFERYQNNTNIVILDACRNNPFASWARGGEAGFKAMSFTSGTIVAYATSEGATAADGKGSNGLYTEELVKQMSITQSINDVFMNTRVQVRKLTNNLQVPSETNKLNGSFFFKK